jgi:hypothetical protein
MLVVNDLPFTQSVAFYRSVATARIEFRIQLLFLHDFRVLSCLCAKLEFFLDICGAQTLVLNFLVSEK